MRHGSSAVVALVLVGCIDVTLPEPPPPPGPGTVQGTVVYAVAGRTGTRPAGGARISLLGTSTQTVADAETGRFVVSGITQSTGRLLFSFDADGDGVDDRQRLLELSAIGAGRGQDVALGEVALSRNATVVGRALRGDNPLGTGHGGTTVFVPGAPYATTTADTGEFVLENLPEGPLQLAFYRAGYAAESRDLNVRGGEESRAASVSLAPVMTSTPATVSGVLRFDDGAPVANARVRFVSSTTTFTATTDANGGFSAQASTGLYQVAIEADGAASVRLYNVLVLPGANDVGEVQLARGTSTPLDLDAGAPVDGGPSGPVALIDPPSLAVAPGGSGTLSSARSFGLRPLTSRWRNAGDGGLALVFAAPDTTSGFTQFTAPDASGRFPVALTVVDSQSRVSAEASATVFVGVRPTVVVSALGGLSVAPAANVTLQAAAQSADGRPVTEYRWAQVTGPRVVIPSPAGPLLSFTAPLVAAPTPMTFELVVVTDVAFESLPATITLVLQPVVTTTVAVAASPSLVEFDGGRSVVRLTASVVGGAPDASWAIDWSPSNDGCPLADGGVDLTCPEGWALSNTAGETTEFLAPAVSGDRTLTFTATARMGGATLSAPVRVQVLDRRPARCTDALSTLSYQVVCDEPLVANNAAFDAGVLADAFIAVDGGHAVVFFTEPLPFAPVQVALSGLTDRAGNAPAPFRTGPLTPSLAVSPRLVTSTTSTTASRPAWVTLQGANGGPARTVVVGRRTEQATNSRMVWELDPASCSGVCTASEHQRIPGVGTAPGPSTSVVSLGGRAWVIVSRDNPAGLVEYSNGVWREVLVSQSPPLLGLAAQGSQLWVLSSDGGVLDRRSWNPGPDGGSYGAPEVITTQLTSDDVELAFSPTGQAFALAADSFGVSQFEAFGSSWTPASFSVDLGQMLRARAVLFGPTLHEAMVVGKVSDGSFEARVNGPVSMTPATPFGVAGTEFDVERFGGSVVVGWGTPSGEIRLSLVSFGPGGPGGQGLPRVSAVSLPDGGLNFNAPTATGFSPRVMVQGAEVFLAWDEEVAAGGPWRMNALRLQ